jgi:HK97 gp10 family phage protein
MSVVVTGIRELDNVFRKLPENISHRILQTAHSKAARPMVRTMRDLAPVRNGTLRDSIGVVRSTLRRANNLGEIGIGPRLGRRGGFHGHLVEFGTRPRRTKKGAYRGRMRKQPFVLPAFERHKSSVGSDILTDIAKSMVSTMKRYGKR